MGVGVFSSDFDGTGNSFIVDGPLAEDKNFEAYLKTMREEHPEILLIQAKDGEWNFRHANDPEPAPDDSILMVGNFSSQDDAFEAACEKHGVFLMDKEQWGQDEYDDVNECLVQSLEGAALQMGLSPDKRKGFLSGVSMETDSDFVRVADSSMIDIGWRSWETDFIVGSACANNEYKDWVYNPDGYRDEIFSEFGLSPDEFSSNYHKLASAVDEYLKLSLMEDGFTCQFRTSGYTVGTYEKPSDIEAQKAVLLETIKGQQQFFAMPPEDRLLSMSDEQRAEFARLMDVMHDNNRYGEDSRETKLFIPVFNPEEGNALWFSPFCSEDGIIAASTLPDEVRDYMKTVSDQPDPVYGCIPIPRVPETEAWFKDRQASHNKTSSQPIPNLVISSQEVANAWGRDLVIEVPVYDADDNPTGATQELTLSTFGPQKTLSM